MSYNFLYTVNPFFINNEESNEETQTEDEITNRLSTTEVGNIDNIFSLKSEDDISTVFINDPINPRNFEDSLIFINSEINILSDIELPNSLDKSLSNNEDSEEINNNEQTNINSEIFSNNQTNFDNISIYRNVNLENFDVSKIEKFENLISEDSNILTTVIEGTLADIIESPTGDDIDPNVDSSEDESSDSSSEPSSSSSSSSSLNEDESEVSSDSSSNSFSALENEEDNDDLIAGKIFSEARAAAKGVAPLQDAVNLALKAKKSTKDVKEELDIVNQASTIERNGKITEGAEEVLITTNQDLTKIIDELVKAVHENSGIEFVANDTLKFSTHKGITFSTDGSFTNISALTNNYSNVLYNTSEYEFNESNLSNNQSVINIDKTKNNISRNVNSLEYSRNREINTEVTSLNATEALQTASKERVEVFERGQTQGIDFRLSIEKNQLNNIGESYVVSVGSPKSNHEVLPAFGPLSFISDNLRGENNDSRGGYLLEVTPESYNLQQEGSIDIHSSEDQTYLGNSIINVSEEDIISISKNDLITFTTGNELHLSNNLTSSTLLGGGTSILGRFSFMGGAIGLINNVAQLVSSILPGIDLPSNLPLPPIGERPSGNMNIDIDACIPEKYRQYVSGQEEDNANLNRDINEELNNEYHFSESPILDDLIETGNLDQTLNNSFSSTFNPLLDSDSQIDENESDAFISGPFTIRPINEEVTPSESVSGTTSSEQDEEEEIEDPIPTEEELIESLEEDLPTGREYQTTRGVETPSGVNARSKTSNDKKGNDIEQMLKSSRESSSVSSSNPNNSSTGLSLEKRIKIRFAPHTYFDLFEEEDFNYSLINFPDSGEAMDVFIEPINASENNNELNQIIIRTIESTIESSNLSEESKSSLLNKKEEILSLLSDLNISSAVQGNDNVISPNGKSLIISQFDSLNLTEEEKEIIYNIYLEVNSNIALSIGIFGRISPIIDNITNVATEVYSQVSNVASQFGIDIGGGIGNSVMDVIDKIKSVNDINSLASLLDKSGNLNRFIPIGQSILAMINNPESRDNIKDTILNTLLPEIEQLIGPSLTSYGGFRISEIAVAISSLLSESALEGMGPEEIFFRLHSILNRMNIVPESINRIINEIGPLMNSFAEGGSINQLIGGEITSLINSKIQPYLSTAENVLGNIESIVGNVNALLSIPTILDAMNEYEIPLLTQISSAIECVDLFSRVKDIVAIVKNPLNYRSNYANPGGLRSIGLPIDSSILNVQSLMSSLIEDIDSSIDQTEIIPSILGVMSHLKTRIGSFSNISRENSFNFNNEVLLEDTNENLSNLEEENIEEDSLSSENNNNNNNNINIFTTPDFNSNLSENIADSLDTNVEDNLNLITGFYSEPRIRSVTNIEGEEIEGYFSIDELGNIRVKPLAQDELERVDCNVLKTRFISSREVISIEENIDLDRVEYGTFLAIDENNLISPEVDSTGLVSYNELINNENYRLFFENEELGEFEITDPEIYYNDVGVADIEGNPIGIWTSGVNYNNGGLDYLNSLLSENVYIYNSEQSEEIVENIEGIIINNNYSGISPYSNILINYQGIIKTLNTDCRGTLNDFILIYKKINEYTNIILTGSNNIREVYPRGNLRVFNNEQLSYSYLNKMYRFNINELKTITILNKNHLIVEWNTLL
ncbi:hypothetical protein V6O07_01015 [Arthrospira platensis SPKY2]